MKAEKGKEKGHFSTVKLGSLPNGRRSKHSLVVNRVLDELWRLDPETALRIARESFGSEKLSNVRAAVSRAVKKHGLDVASATDDGFFYLWFKSRKPAKANGDGRKISKANGDGRKISKANGDGSTRYQPPVQAGENLGSEGAGRHFKPPTDGEGRRDKR